ncbi:MAG: hypothetical protein U0X41_03280 [Chitinophagales bacterium]
MEHLTQEIKLRVTEDMKAYLQKLAEKDRRKLSDYIRLKLDEVIEKDKFNNELPF